MRNFVTFECADEDAPLADAKGNILSPAGRLTLTALNALFVADGMSAEPPVQHRFYGWKSLLRHSNDAYELLLQYAGPWLLIVQPQGSSVAKLLRIDRPRHEAMMRNLDRLLKGSAKFVNVRWYSRQEYEANADGHASP